MSIVLHGIFDLLKRSIQNLDFLFFNVNSISDLKLLIFLFLLLLSENFLLLKISFLDITEQRFLNILSLPAAIIIFPLEVLKAPKGAIEGWSVPKGSGLFPETEYLAIAFSRIAI